MKFHYSRHARNRMRLYRTAAAEVEKALMQGSAQPDPKSRGKHDFFSAIEVEDRILKVAFAREDDEIFVKTVYPLRKASGGQ